MLNALIQALLGRGTGPDPEDLRDGFRVHVPAGSRGEALAYEEPHRRLLAEITSDGSGRTVLWLDTLDRWEADAGTVPVSAAERAVVAARMAAWLARRGEVAVNAARLPPLDEALPGIERELARHGWRLRLRDGVMVLERDAPR